MIVDLFNKISSVGSSLEKTAIMNEALQANKELISMIYKDCYDKHNYFIKKLPAIENDLFSDSLDWTIDDHYSAFHEALSRLENREVTGNYAISYINGILLYFRKEDREYLVRILQHDLNIGFSLTSLYNIIGEPDEKHIVSLATNLDKTKGINPVDGTWYASRKLDGVRCVAFVSVKTKEDGTREISEPILKSRQNKVFTTLDKLKPAVREFAETLDDGHWVLDGECCILDDNGDEHFDWIMREISRKDHTIDNPCYNIFDIVTEDIFYGRVKSEPFSERLKMMTEAYYVYGGDRDRIHLLHQELLTSQDDFDRWSQYVSDGHWEGFMLRHNVPYEGGRTKDLLKVKKFKDAEYVVEDVIEGQVKYGTETFDAVTALVFDHKGTKVQVGSGLSKEQRLEWAHHSEKIVGKTITVQYFEETVDKEGNLSLRFPVLKYVYDNGRDC